MPGETVIPTKMSKKYAPLINGMIAEIFQGIKLEEDCQEQQTLHT
jgi:hypothetical protein